MYKRFLLACSLGMAFIAHAEDAAIARHFQQAGLEGTIVIESMNTGQRFVHNDARASTPYIAASTFKILNTLIALEEGVIIGAEASIPWNGTAYEIAEWNRDQTLESAFKLSCVWCYQRLAQRVGPAKYTAHIRQARYGRLTEEPYHPTEFWLDGALTISAEQQVAFLRQIVTRRLPYQSSSYETLKRIMLAEHTPHYRLYAKTGWATRTTPALGWYVGYLETQGDTWLFALNLNTRDANDLPLRVQIAKAALRSKGVLPGD